MTQKNQDFTMYAGDTKNLVITIQDDVGNVKSLVGATATWKMADYDSEQIVITKTIGNGIEITDAVNGLLIVSLVRDDTINLLGKFMHECKVVDSEGEHAIVTTGIINIRKSLIT